MKSLLQWVVSGLDELDQHASEADTASFEHAMSSPELYPSYQPLAVPGPGPNSPPLEPAKLGEDVNGMQLSDSSVGLGGSLDRQKSAEDPRARWVTRLAPN